MAIRAESRMGGSCRFEKLTGFLIKSGGRALDEPALVVYNDLCARDGRCCDRGDTTEDMGP